MTGNQEAEQLNFERSAKEIAQFLIKKRNR